MKTIAITGGTGFVGKHLTGLLVSKGYEVIILTRSVKDMPPMEHVTYAHWDAGTGACDINALKKADAAIYLAGAGIADKRWTDKRRQEITDSRIKATDFFVARLKEYAPQCKTYIAASAMGYYGADRAGAIPFTENAAPADDFLGVVCRQWEGASQKANEFARTVILRFGIVLGKEGGAFPKFSMPMSLGVMPVLGTGRQVMSWVEVSDLSRLILFSLESSEVSGIYNAVAPGAVTHLELMKTIAKAKGGMKMPVPVPAFVLKTLLGEMSGELLKSYTISAQKTMSAGFSFNYPDITSAVKQCL